jgi:protein-histidine pros-kinase
VTTRSIDGDKSEDQLRLLRESDFTDASFRAFLEWAPDGIVVTDAQGTILFANRQIEALLGYEQGALIDQSIEVLLPEERRAAHAGYREEYARAPRTRPMGSGFDLAARRKDGVIVPVEVSLSPTRTANGLLVTSIVRDISERKRIEREKDQLRAREQAASYALQHQKDEFLASVSHDLRTPLTAIKASIGVVLANEPPDLPEPIHRMLVNIDLAADRMARLVADLLELTRLQAGRVELKQIRCDLVEIATRTAHAIEPLLATRSQRIELDLPAKPLYVSGDPDRLERAVLNLLDNAHKYGRDRGTITLRLDRRGHEAIVSVADDGPGIPFAEQAHIFERFYRSETEAARRNQGSGLGLPIARAMVELHHGRIWVESAPGEGATFHIALPVHTSRGQNRPLVENSPKLEGS